ncbi:sce7725 family protein [Aquiflexum sp. TKW24L]|uniref:sce7725 family protein n=1 Tax=Aquiflexum sp. TKW24L TaxID=2942212 RepID=UPI0020BFC533|nr:sce7725 family protein [Aquiflexum sp. TKW24L]MCL6260117.1 sce7725 family protein [Aquiflexum sp. TKW24L]
MYYPFLRARQFELIALRELAIEGALQGVIIPILEPVKETHNNLNLAHKVFKEKDQTAYLIVNSNKGGLEEDNPYYIGYLATINDEVFMPAFHYRNNAEYIYKSIEQFGLTNCMLICENDIEGDDINFKSIAELAAISHITVNDPGRNRSLNRYIRGLQKDFIRLDDLFEKKDRNSDFLGIIEHRFSEEHIHYTNEGFEGFSDYTVLPKEYVEGGSTPRAVVIHLTYLNSQNEIWIRHFTSETNDSIANVQGKFAEAAAKAVNYCRRNGLSNSAITELETYFDTEHYPGLGTVKKLSIKNHLLVLSNFLRNR